MKSRFTTLDITVIVKELRRFLGMRVVNIYDVDNKTYLIKIAKPDDKAIILLESGIRLHSTAFDWPKNPAPSGFSMKMRKHLRGRRFEKIEQLGTDRIVDMQFGSGEAAYHVILELYDRGNIVLTDSEYTILNILRPRTDNSQDVRFAVRELYPIAAAKNHEMPTEEKLVHILMTAKEGDSLKRALIPHLDYGPAVIGHCLLTEGMSEDAKIGKDFSISADIKKLMTAIETAESLMSQLSSQPCKGFITQRMDKKPNPKEGESTELATYEEFHPYLFLQLQNKQYLIYDMFDKAVDEFFSKIESQKLDVKMLQQEKAALKKLDNVKKDHEKRVGELQKEQESDIVRGQLIEMNLEMVDQAILIVRSALANQIDWTEIDQIVKEAQLNGDAVAKTVVGLKLDSNHITLLLQYFERKRQAAKKEMKTLEASQKALKSAEKKTKETLKDMATAVSINKTRKTYWFEKFLWFITSENYLVIGGRDQQQNEMIVKRHLKPGDLYVHADLHGASSVVIKNPSGEPVPPKTLNEAGTMAICNSAAWDAKVVTSAWWVYHDQVSKTAPSGEYLTTGSFMIRGKKNYLPPSYLIYGFGFLFKLEDGSIPRHMGERRVRTTEEDSLSQVDSHASEAESELSLNLEEENSKNGSNKECSSNSSNDTDDDDHESDYHDDEVSKPALDSPHEVTVTSCPDSVSSESQKEIQVDKNNAFSEDKGKDCSLGNDTDDDKQPHTAAAAIEFPDTSITLMHIKGDKYELQRGTSMSSTVSETDSTVIYLGDDKPVVFGEKGGNRGGGRLSARQRRELRKTKKSGEPMKQTVDGEEETVSWLHEVKDENQLKNQQEYKNKVAQQDDCEKQEGKLRKIKEKYGDQDEEERRIRMEILADPASDGEQVGADEETQKTDDIQILNSLTGQPHPEDELLYAIPCCAPYNAMTNYKFKVKLLPGTTKRGKAAKMAINMFQHDKMASAREKDLLRIMKDADISRNMPGKVKVAAPSLHKR
ncbi:hypothetical protein C0Q70_13204 [Pomacea canaliculata]|uniref:NFACT RNA-binding domain-containing protein n=1 Tax=Pomacea canaliculata TaxID=400727 RepID=A0A2T7NWK7_POMCA|nr:hypothetical protein C0Q70_13204 [Pomacea canaliculata]